MSPYSEPGTSPQPMPPNCTWQEARQAASLAAPPLPAARVPLPEAVGRTLAVEMTSLQDIPHYASSAMDGWATSGCGPWILAEAGEPLERGRAARIVTGGLIPPGTGGVLRLENGQVTSSGGGEVLQRTAGAPADEPRAGQHIRKAGQEAASGEVLVPAGTVLNPAHVALAALAGHDALPVLGKPVVRLLLTGSEVIARGIPAPGMVRDAFGPQLGSVVEMLGGLYGGQVRIGDDYGAWTEALKAPAPGRGGGLPDCAAPAHVTITTGGTGPSGSDHLRKAVAGLGGRLLIDGIAMRPGHPTVLAVLPGRRFIIGLPGNPLAAMMALLTVGAPLLAALGHRDGPGTYEVPSGSSIKGDQTRTLLVPFQFVEGRACPAENIGPGMMRGLASSDGIMVLPPGGVQLGEAVGYIPLPWTEPLPRCGGLKPEEGWGRPPVTTAAKPCIVVGT